MIRIVGIGVGAGLATALLFAALATATPLALPLFFVSPLPIAIVTLGWGWISGGVAALVAGMAVSVALGVAMVNPLTGAVFTLVYALPMVWLAHVAGLSRPTEAGEPEGAREWFPYGGILTHAVLLVAGSLVIAGVLAAYEPTRLVADVIEALTAWLATQPPSIGVIDAGNVAAFSELAVALLPYMLASLTLVMLVLSLWLAAQITARSGLLARPLTPVSDTVLPPWLVGVLAAALVGTFLPFPLGTAAAPLVGAAALAFALAGLATVHALTRGHPARGVILGGTYVAVVVFGLPMVLLTILGMADSLLDLRARFRGRFPL